VLYCNSAVTAQRPLKNWPADDPGLRVGLNAGFLSGGKLFDQAVREAPSAAPAPRSGRRRAEKFEARGRFEVKCARSPQAGNTAGAAVRGQRRSVPLVLQELASP
jgi:hypothetical protein